MGSGHRRGLKGKWKPKNPLTNLTAWSIMSCLTLFGWAIFRADNLTWLFGIFSGGFTAGFTGDSLISGLNVVLSVAVFASPLFFLMLIDRTVEKLKYVHAVVYAMAVVAIIIFSNNSSHL